MSRYTHKAHAVKKFSSPPNAFIATINVQFCKFINRALHFTSIFCGCTQVLATLSRWDYFHRSSQRHNPLLLKVGSMHIGVHEMRLSSPCIWLQAAGWSQHALVLRMHHCRTMALNKSFYSIKLARKNSYCGVSLLIAVSPVSFTCSYLK